MHSHFSARSCDLHVQELKNNSIKYIIGCSVTVREASDHLEVREAQRRALTIPVIKQSWSWSGFVLVQKVFLVRRLEQQVVISCKYIPLDVWVPVPFLILWSKLQFWSGAPQKLLVCHCFVGLRQTKHGQYLEECYYLHKINKDIIYQLR